MAYYSQNDEEKHILDLFGGATTGGRFLEIGAWDGKTLSNTLRLVELGWSGVMVEPSPFCFPQLVINHGSNPGIDLVHAAIGPSNDLVEWWDSLGDAVSTMIEGHKVRWEAGSQVKFKRFFVPTITLETLFRKVGPEYDFISLDTESLNLALFREMVPHVASTRVRVICVEHDGHSGEMLEIASKAGFEKYAMNGENLILKR